MSNTVITAESKQVINALSDFFLKCPLMKDGQFNIDYLESNFKKQNGYKRSVELAKENDLYRQNYCGCEFALRVQMKEAPESLNKKY